MKIRNAQVTRRKGREMALNPLGFVVFRLAEGGNVCDKRK